MKHSRVDEPIKETSSGVGLSNATLFRQSPSHTTSTVYTPAGTAIRIINEDMPLGSYTNPNPSSFGTMPSATSVPHPQNIRNTTTTTGTSPPQEPPQPQVQSPNNNFHRLKVEDALSYLDLVKYKFNNKPQVYNDFLDIMKEFKSQSIDTPGVIQRVSNLFRGFPDLIVGFNTFLPPGYKIEVQKNNEGYAFQVSVSMPSPTGSVQSDNATHHKSSMIMKGSGIINNSVGSTPPSISQIPQNLTVQSHAVVPPVTQQQQQQQQTPAVVQPIVQHHTTNYGSNSLSYNTLSLSTAQAAVTQALQQQQQGHTETPQNQPVEFNHAINYVNKIKNRFQGQPEKYKRFLEILHTYQKEQRTLKETTPGGLGGKQLTEQEVYSQVAKLFENQSDLLAEFGQFLPDATSHIYQVSTSEHLNIVKKQPNTKQTASFRDNLVERHLTTMSSNKPTHHHHHVSSGQIKRSSPTYAPHHHPEAPPMKKHKIASCRDVTLAEAGKYGTLNDYAFFDKVRKAVKTQEGYNSFLRCLNLFNYEIVSKSELVLMVTPFLSKFPELLRWFRDFIGQNNNELMEATPFGSLTTTVQQGDRSKTELAQEIDLATAKRLGASYCAIPLSQEGQQCSGRTQLCKEVLNDQWVSFPTWSEDSTFVSSRKTQYEEYMYRCEDERFELDVIIETNASTIRILEAVNKKLGRMSQDEVARYRLDDTLGGNSSTLHQRALKRIYGDKALDIIDGLKRNPGIAVPVVLRRLKIKEEEWREAQKGFNKIWREQNEKYYLKSLDHQGINFKQNDMKALRSKSLLNEIETIFDERHEQQEEGATGTTITGPHLSIPFKDRTIFDDAANLLIHNVKRQTGIQKSEKRQIKYILLQFLPDLFFHPRQHLSDDEREDEENDKDDNVGSDSDTAMVVDVQKSVVVVDNDANNKSPGHNNNGDDAVKLEAAEVKEEPHLPAHAQTTDPEEAYTLFLGNNNWYIFLRLYAILCERLGKIYERAVVLAEEEAKQRPKRKESTAIALRLKPKPKIEIQDYYPAFLDMVKNLLDGNMDGNAYEDTLREMFGIHAYIAFTLDKEVSYTVRQLQHCVTEKTALSCMELFAKEQKRGATGGSCCTAYKRAVLEGAYQRAAEKTLQGENCFKMFIYKNDCRVTIELLDTENEIGKKTDEAKKWSMYKECYVSCGAQSSSDGGNAKCPLFLDRNLRKNRDKVELLKYHHRRERSGEDDRSSTIENESEDKNFEMTVQKFEEKLLLERGGGSGGLPQRNLSDDGDYKVEDETECTFNAQDSKIVFTLNKDSYIYKIGAFGRARRTHEAVTRRLSKRFRDWLEGWVGENVSDAQHKRCCDWLMGRGEGTVPNRTRILTDNELSRTPYVPYNRYKVERMGGGEEV